MSVPVTGPITVYPSGAYPTFFTNEGFGSFKVFATTTARNTDVTSFPLRYEQGTIVFSNDTNVLYYLNTATPAGTNADWTAVTGGGGGSGTVTSVTFTGDGTVLSSTPSGAVTTSGTLTATLNTQLANVVLAGPTTGSAVAPTFRALVAADIPNLSAAKITSGQLAVAQGGTASATLTAHAVLLGEGTSALGFATIGTSGALLIDQGSGVDPSFNAMSGDITITNAGVTTIGNNKVTTAKINAAAVTYAKIQNVAASSLLGNPTGSPAAPSEITLGQNLSFSGTTLVASGGVAGPMAFWLLGAAGTGMATGTQVGEIRVCGVAGGFGRWDCAAKTGPTGASIILDVKKSSDNGVTWTSLWASNPGNRPTIAAGATAGSGSSFDTTTFAAGDWLLPDIVQVGSTVAGSDVTLSLTSTGAGGGSGGSGTVTSVGLSLPAIITVSNSPVTASGTLTGTLATQSANLVWAGPTTGAASAPTFRSLVVADLPTTGLVINQHTSAITADSDGATITFNLATTDWHSVTLGGNRTLALSNASTGQSFTLILVQDSTGNRTVTWFSGIKWSGGNAPPLSTSANATDVFTFKCTGTGAYLGFTAGLNMS